MTRPEDISERAWEAATEPAMIVFDASVDMYETGSSAVDVQCVIARAIDAETELCAKIADMFAFDEHELAQATEQGKGADRAARDIAQAIRSPHV